MRSLASCPRFEIKALRETEDQQKKLIMKTVKQLLQDKGSTVHTIHPDAIVFESLKAMSDRNIGALVVIEEDEVVGLLSEREYTRK